MESICERKGDDDEEEKKRKKVLDEDMFPRKERKIDIIFTIKMKKRESESKVVKAGFLTKVVKKKELYVKVMCYFLRP